MAVTGISHACLFIELAQLVILWQPHCDLRVVRATTYIKAIMEIYGKTFTGLGTFKETSQWIMLSV